MEDTVKMGLGKQWLEVESYFVMQLTDSNRKTVDMYCQTNIDIFEAWDTTQPLFMLHDVSDDKVTLTPYLKGRINELGNYVKTHGIQLNLALVVKNNLSGQVMRAFGRLFNVAFTGLNIAFFTELSHAKAWIAKQQSKS